MPVVFIVDVPTITQAHQTVALQRPYFTIDTSSTCTTS